MDLKRLTLAAVVAWFVNLLYGMSVHVFLLGGELAKYTSAFRSEAAINAHVPGMLAGELFAIFVLAGIYSRGRGCDRGIVEGLRFGLLLGLFLAGFVSVHLYGALNIGGRLALLGSASLVAQVTLIGAVIGALYRPDATRSLPRKLLQ